MSDLNDREIERLSQLLASGSLKNAREIVRLLNQELGETRVRPHSLMAAMSSLFKANSPSLRQRNG
jgi:hypothetical protein